MSIATRPDLTDLAELANREHRACETALQAGLQHALNAGQALTEAKAQCPHGEWLPWLQEHFEGSERTAQAYMRVAREWPALQADQKRNGVADLSYREALKALAEPVDDDPPAKTENPYRQHLDMAAHDPRIHAWLAAHPRERDTAMIFAEIWELAPGIDFTPVGITPGSIPENLPQETWEQVLKLLLTLPVRWEEVTP